MTNPQSNIPALVEEGRALLAKATPGPWYHYDEIFRKQFGRRRITELQDDKGRSIVKWPGFDGSDHERRKNHDVRLIVFLRNNADLLLDALSQSTDHEATRAGRE